MKGIRLQVLILCLFLSFSCDEEGNGFPDVRITQFPHNKRAAVSITFDDGCPSVFTKIAPLLEENNLRATFFIIAAAAEKYGEWAKWNALIDKGHEVANHSLTHCCYLGSVNDFAVLKEEIDSSYRLLSANLRRPPFSFGHPFHSTSPKVDSMVFKHHYVSKISPPGFCYMIPLYNEQIFKDELEDAITNGRWLVTTAHGIDDCFAPMTSDLLQQTANLINEHRDDLHCDTFENLSKYKIERNNTNVHIDHNESGYRVTLVSNLPKLFSAPLTVAVSGFAPEQYIVSSINGSVLETFIEGGSLYVTTSANGSFLLVRK